MINLNELNDSQRKAVEYLDGPSLVIAGAGSGKTRVLTYKIAYLLEHGYEPWNILALTFTNKAAREMQQRISRQVGEQLALPLWMGTFHSIFSRILRIESATIGFTSNFTIYDATDSKSLVKTLIKEMSLDDKVYKPGLVANRISEAKNRLVLPSQYKLNSQVQKRDQASKTPLIGELYERYCSRCRMSDAMDFDDLLLQTYQLFLNHPEICQKYEERFRYVLVDEYQDTNYAQHMIVWLLTRNHQHVSVVGDDAQSIYSFRGANIDNMLRFKDFYKSAQYFKLEQNYRSTQTIVQAANQLIHHNRSQIEKDVFSENSVGNRITLINSYSDIEESKVVSKMIRRFHRDEHIGYNDIAILYRTNSQSRSFEDALRQDALPYRIYGGMSFYQRKEIKDVIAYLRLAVNPHDEEALKRVINYPARGIGQTTVDKIFQAALRQGVSPWDVVADPSNPQYGLVVNKGMISKLHGFVEKINAFQQLAFQENAFTVSKTIILESGIQGDIFQGNEPEDISRQENLQEMMDSLAAWVDQRHEEDKSVALTEYLQEVSLLTDMDEKRTGQGCDDCITLMTVHSAKGLEFKVVFVVGLEEGLFPNQMALDEGSKGLEEERRLMYVAMTRAEEHLILTNAKSRYRYGHTEMSSPSRFLNEIDKKFIQSSQSQDAQLPFANQGYGTFNRSNERTPFGPQMPPRPAYKPVAVPTESAQPVRKFTKVSSVPKTAVTSQGAVMSGDLTVGSQIEHARFGIGEVISLEGSGLDAKATVHFKNLGIKQLLLRFAKYKIIK